MLTKRIFYEKEEEEYSISYACLIIQSVVCASKRFQINIFKSVQAHIFSVARELRKEYDRIKKGKKLKNNNYYRKKR